MIIITLLLCRRNIILLSLCSHTYRPKPDSADNHNNMKSSRIILCSRVGTIKCTHYCDFKRVEKILWNIVTYFFRILAVVYMTRTRFQKGTELRCYSATVLCIIFIVINAYLAMAIRDNFWPMTRFVQFVDGIYTQDRNGQSLVFLHELWQ